MTFASRKQRAGFTLIESLVSLALLAILMVTLNSFLFSMSELWGDRRDQRLFDQHVRAATQQLRKTLEAATLGPGASGVIMQDTVTKDGTTEGRLNFLLGDAGRLANWPVSPLPDVDFSLYVDNEKGLVLQWQSRLELERDLKDFHETVLTPFVTSINYEYYDATLKRWHVEEAPLHDTDGTTWLQPNRLYLNFAHGNLKATTFINMPIKRVGATRP